MNYLYLLIILYLIPLICYIIIYNIYNKYNNIDNKKELSGFEVARNILDKHKLEEIYIVEKRGLFTDTYDSNQNVIRFSTSVFHEESMYSLALASYIATKAFLYNKDDKTIKIKVLLDNFINLLTTFLYLLLLIGIAINSLPTYKVVVYLFIFILLYKIFTIPIEDKISNISIQELINKKYITENNKEIKKIYNYLKIYSISQIVLSLTNLYYSVRDNIKK